MDPYGPTYTTHTLERFKFALGQAISEELIEDMGVTTAIDVQRVDYLARTIVVRIRLDVFGEHLERKTVRYPADWWQSVKAALWAWFGTEERGHWPWFGDYARAHWPVRYVVVDIDVTALYSKISVPEYRPYVTVLRHEVVSR